MSNAMSGAYAGLKVVDLSQGVAGPYCARMLRENGAEVTKIEPISGDWGRGIGFASNGLSALSIVNNSGKRSIAIDATTPNGRMLLRMLCTNAEVLIESFRPGVMERLGLSWNSMIEQNPGLIYVSVTAFGPTGPYAARPGSDSTIQAISGLMQANADKDGAPKKVGTLVIDVISGVYAAHATSAALYKKVTTGKGSRVEVSLLECALAMQGNSIVDANLNKGRPSAPLTVPAGTFTTSDGFINVSSLHDRMFAGLCRAIGREDLLTDERFNSAEMRSKNASTINLMLESIFASRSSSFWEDCLSREGVVCGVVKDYASMQLDPQVRALDLFCEVNHCFGATTIPRVPGSPRKLHVAPSPRMGENTVEILEELGFGKHEIQVFIEEGVVLQAQHLEA